MAKLRAFGFQRSTAKPRKRRPRAEAAVEEVFARQRPTIRRTTLAVFVLRIAPVIVPIVLRVTLDPLLGQESRTIFGADFSAEQLLGMTVVAGVLVALARAVGKYYYVALAGKSGHALVADLRVAMYEHILRVPVSYADRRGTGKILLRFIGDSDALRVWVSRTSPSITADRVLVLILLAAMFFVEWHLALILVIPLPLLLLTLRRLSPRLRDLTLRSRGLQARLTGNIAARLGNLRQAKWFDCNHKSRRRMRELAETIAAQNIRRDQHAAVVKSLGQFLAFLAVPLLIGFGVWSVWTDAVTVGQCVALVWLAAHLSVTVNRLASAVVVQQKAAVSLERILRLLERPAERGRSSKRPVFKPAGESIICQDVVFTEQGLGASQTPLTIVIQGPGITVLDAQLDATAFYDLVLGFAQLSAGRMLLDSQNHADVRISSVRQAIGWLPPKPVFFEGTVLENIRLASPAFRRSEVVAIIEESWPSGDAKSWLQKQVGSNGQDLTREEQLRIGILRLLASAPAFVLIDDIPCPPGNTADLRRAIERLSETAVVCVAQRIAIQLGIASDARRSAESVLPDQPAARSVLAMMEH